MKKISIITLALIAGIAGFGQVTNSFESGNREIDMNNCWMFSSTSISTNSKISGSYSMQTGQLSDGLHYLISPWIVFSGSGSLTFKHKMDANQKFDRSLIVQLLDQGGNVAQTLYTYDYPGDKRTVITANVPVGFSGVYRVKWIFTGSNGTARGILDEISIPGTYNSDPTSNNGSGDCASIPTVKDADKDGVADSDDAYPNDAYRAYNNVYPVKEWGSLAFEDMWPSKGDYDFNDLVVDYQMVAVTDAQNEIVEIKASFLTRAIGASFHSAFALNLINIPSTAVYSVSNSLENAVTSNHFKLWDTGVEAGQTWATVIVYDNAFKVLPHPGTGAGVNTTPGAPYVEPMKVDILVTLKENGIAKDGAIRLTDWPESNVNFFIVTKADHGRGIEIHLPDYHPTDLADKNLFGTVDDASNLGTSHTYRSTNNLPWAINLLSSFAYPIEKGDIVKAHLMFGPWAETGGEKYVDWYLDLGDNRNYELIYRH